MDVESQSRRRWLVAGSSGGERAPVDKVSARSERWFEPLHVQDPVAARERISLQVAAGADIVIAPTWRTHRRALMDVGESRRAREWTEAAVRVAREGVDAGLERREDTAVAAREGAAVEEDETAADADDPTPPLELESAPPLVAGVLAAFDDAPEPGTGRLLPREPAAVRDYEEAAGHLADADVDLILVETRADDRGLRSAVGSAALTGLPTWVAAIGPLPQGADVEGVLAAWAETSIDAGASGLLFPDSAAEVASRVAEGHAVPTWGGLVGGLGDRSVEHLAEAASAWLAVGARAVAILSGARPDRVAAIRSSIDDVVRGERQAARTRDERWDAFVARGASMAPGGAALWLGSRSTARSTLPAGFDWTIASPEEAHHLPRERYRLVVAPAGTGVAPAAVPGLLAAAGILVATLEAESGPAASTDAVRLVEVDPLPRPAFAIYRREA